jgi:hypothetical protein
MWMTERQDAKQAAARGAERETPHGCGRNQNRMSVRILNEF